MRKIAVAAIAVLMTGTAMAEDGASVTLSADLASAYVFRGSTFNDGAVLQPGIEVGGLPVTVGVWANFDIDDYDGALKDSQFSEIDIYASYALPVEAVELTLGYCEYTYPGAEAEADREAQFSIGIPVALSPSISFNYGIDGGIEKSLYIEAGISHEMEPAEGVTLSMGASAGYLEPDEGESGFSHYTVSAGAEYEIFSLSLNYVGQIDDDVLPDTEDGGSYDVGFYATLGVSKEF